MTPLKQNAWSRMKSKMDSEVKRLGLTPELREYEITGDFFNYLKKIEVGRRVLARPAFDLEHTNPSADPLVWVWCGKTLFLADAAIFKRNARPLGRGVAGKAEDSHYAKAEQSIAERCKTLSDSNRNFVVTRLFDLTKKKGVVKLNFRAPTNIGTAKNIKAKRGALLEISRTEKDGSAYNLKIDGVPLTVTKQLMSEIVMRCNFVDLVTAVSEKAAKKGV